MRYNDGFFIGTGAALNIALGFVPSWVRLINVEDADRIFEGPVAQVVAFDNNGTVDSAAREIKAGMRIDAGDDGWRGIVKQVIVESGAWASGNAAGFLVIEGGTLEGAANLGDNDEIHASEQVDLKGAATGFNLAGAGLQSVGITVLPHASDQINAFSGITPYYGSEASKAQGFTVNATVSESDKLIAYQAWAPDPGSGPVDESRG